MQLVELGSIFKSVNYIANPVCCSWKNFVDDYKLYLSILRSIFVHILQGMMQLRDDFRIKVCSFSGAWNLKRNISMCCAKKFSVHQASDKVVFNHNIDDNISDIALYLGVLIVTVS